MDKQTFALQELYEILLPLGNDFSDEFKEDASKIIDAVCLVYGIEDSFSLREMLFDDYILTLEDYAYLQRLREIEEFHNQHRFYYDIKAEVMNRYKESVGNTNNNNAMKVEFYNRKAVSTTLKELVDRGNFFACRTYAFILYCGIGVEKDVLLASECFLQCAFWGDGISQAMLTLCLPDGDEKYKWGYVHNQYAKNNLFATAPIKLNKVSAPIKAQAEQLHVILQKLFNWINRTKSAYIIDFAIVNTLKNDWLTFENKIQLLDNSQKSPWWILEDLSISKEFKPSYSFAKLDAILSDNSLQQVKKLIISYTKKRQSAVKALIIRGENINAVNAVGRLFIDSLFDVPFVEDTITKLLHIGSASLLFNQAKVLGKDGYVLLIDNPTDSEVLFQIISQEGRASFFDATLGISICFKNVLPIIATDGTMNIPATLLDEVYVLDVDALDIINQELFINDYLIPELRKRLGDETVEPSGNEKMSGNASVIANLLTDKYFLDAKLQSNNVGLGFGVNNGNGGNYGKH